MGIRDHIRKWVPAFLLKWYRSKKKDKVRRVLNTQKETGDIITESHLIRDFKSAGLGEGDTVLVHSRMSRIGYLENGPETFVNALMKVVGGGNILMPSSPNPGLQIDYIRSNQVFDVMNSPSRMGAITEYFRTLPGVKRSVSATEPVCVFGPDSEYLVSGHFKELTPYTERSPFYRLYEKKGKILYVGVTLDNAGTNLHTLEDAVDFPYPVYYPEEFEVKIILPDKSTEVVRTKVHNPLWSAKRKCDELLPMFRKAGVMSDVFIGKAPTLVFDGEGMFRVMLNAFDQRGVTMYHPTGI